MAEIAQCADDAIVTPTGIPGMFLTAPLMALMRNYNFSRPLERLLAAD